MDKPRSFAPFISAALLLLPVLYVGCYLVLVFPAGVPIDVVNTKTGEVLPFISVQEKYLIFDRQAKRLFWPLEQIDRRVRPSEWESKLQKKLRAIGKPIR
jgi:hypothetical protein